MFGDGIRDKMQYNVPGREVEHVELTKVVSL